LVVILLRSFFGDYVCVGCGKKEETEEEFVSFSRVYWWEKYGKGGKSTL
jgi:hypothetical protein